MSFVQDKNIVNYDAENLGNIPEIVKLISNEVSRLVSAKNQFAPFEKIYRFKIINRDFKVGKELSAKMELLRPYINSNYKKEIEDLTK